MMPTRSNLAPVRAADPAPDARPVPDGIGQMHREMARQCADALATLDGCAAAAALVAEALRETRRVALYGMGGSHYVNRMVEPLYRDAGLDARAFAASEALMAPLPPAERVALIASQSGESGEIVEFLGRASDGDRRFGLTLNATSTLGRSVEAVLVAAGGPENAFAATRSIILTIAMHAAILHALGQDQDALRGVLRLDARADVTAVTAALLPCDLVVFAGRHVQAGTAESAALSLMELSRMPAIGFETGQFRHGPFEFLRPGLGVVLLRSEGPDSEFIAPIAAATQEAGCSTVVLDCAEGPLPPGVLRVRLPGNAGLAAAAAMLLWLQQLNIALALRRIPIGAGTPLRTSKVTV